MIPGININLDLQEKPWKENTSSFIPGQIYKINNPNYMTFWIQNNERNDILSFERTIYFHKEKYEAIYALFLEEKTEIVSEPVAVYKFESDAYSSTYTLMTLGRYYFLIDGCVCFVEFKSRANQKSSMDILNRHFELMPC
jgi:hypothetical protein